MSVQALAFVVTAALAGAPERPLAIRAAHVDLGDGRSIEQGIILIEGGVIRAVGAGVDVPENADRIEHSGHASPGFVGLHAFSGATGALRDPTRAILPEAHAALAFDPDHFEFEEALEAGITSLVLTPSPQSLAGGTSAVVKTSGGRVVEPQAQLSLGFSASALSSNRFPTSYSGALAALDERFTDPKGPFALAAAGKLPILFDARSRADVQRAVDFAARHDLGGAITGADWPGELADVIKPSGLSVICGPFAVGADRRALRSTVALAEAGVPIAFAFDAPFEHPIGLRVTVAQCLREGLDRSAAWKGLCANAAATARVGDKVGRLERGLAADVVLWSGDPLDLSSHVVAVFVDGARAWKETP